MQKEDVTASCTPDNPNSSMSISVIKKKNTETGKNVVWYTRTSIFSALTVHMSIFYGNKKSSQQNI